jgi:hypothetical protein
LPTPQPKGAFSKRLPVVHVSTASQIEVKKRIALLILVLAEEAVNTPTSSCNTAA